MAPRKDRRRTVLADRSSSAEPTGPARHTTGKRGAQCSVQKYGSSGFSVATVASDPENGPGAPCHHHEHRHRWRNTGSRNHAPADGGEFSGLAGLQKAIRAGVVPPFEKLTGTTSQEFYRQDRGTNYSQARYLCYYLQEQHLLVQFFHRFRENRKEDPTGYQTLREVLGEDDMDAFQAKWQEYVLKLRFP